MLLLIDRIKEKLFRTYNKKVFLTRIGAPPRRSCNLLGKVYVINKNIIIGNNVTIYPNVLFHGDGQIVIGDNVSIGNDTIIYSSKAGGVCIGNDVSIAAHCYIIDSDHGMNKNELIRKQCLVSGKIEIGNDVWIGDNCTILKNCIIHDGAVIGAKSLVNKEIDYYGIAVGVPAKVIKFRK